jgi:hypothetical protein
MYDAFLPALSTLAVLADGVVEGPEPEDVKAGWGAFGIFLLLVAAVVLLSFSLVKQLRKAQSAKDAGVYGDDPAEADAPDDPGSPAGPRDVTPGTPGP